MLQDRISGEVDWQQKTYNLTGSGNRTLVWRYSKDGSVLAGRDCGWAQYFSQGYPAKAYRQVNWYTRDRLTTHLRRRSQRPYKPPKGVTYYEQLYRLGLVYLKPEPKRIL